MQWSSRCGWGLSNRRLPCGPHVTSHVVRLIAALEGEMSRTEFMNVLGLADRRYFAMTYLRPGVEGGFGRDDAPGQSEKQGAKIPADHLGRASTRFPGGTDGNTSRLCSRRTLRYWLRRPFAPSEDGEVHAALLSRSRCRHAQPSPISWSPSYRQMPINCGVHTPLMPSTPWAKF